MSRENPPPTPVYFFETVNAFQRTEALRAAIELDLFTAIGEGSTTLPALAKRCAASERGLRILCDYLTVLGFVSKSNGSYALTPDSALFLDRRSPAYLGNAIDFMLATPLMDTFRNLAACVRRGGTTLPEQGSTTPEHPMWVTFAQSMGKLMAPAAEVMAEAVGAESTAPLRILDVAAGHGIFGITLAGRYPNAEVVALDWPNVLEVAKGNAARAQLDGRYETLPGSAFDVEWGTGFDLVLLTNFLHHFDAEGCDNLLAKAHAALKPGGRVFTLDMAPNADRVTPGAAAAFALVMLATTPAGDAYTLDEYNDMMRRAGFGRTEAIPLEGGLHTLLIAHKEA
jgi:ubiquinone/menaquinone biosynthesis C-methylase UbiE